MPTPRVTLPPYRIERRDRAAGELQLGDFVDDPLTAFVVNRFGPSPDHVVVVIGRLASGTNMTIRYLATTMLDVSRVVWLSPPAAAFARRRHLSICPPIGGTQ